MIDITIVLFLFSKLKATSNAQIAVFMNFEFTPNNLFIAREKHKKKRERKKDLERETEIIEEKKNGSESSP